MQLLTYLGQVLCEVRVVQMLQLHLVGFALCPETSHQFCDWLTQFVKVVRSSAAGTRTVSHVCTNITTHLQYIHTLGTMP